MEGGTKKYPDHYLPPGNNILASPHQVNLISLVAILTEILSKIKNKSKLIFMTWTGFNRPGNCEDFISLSR